MSEREIKIFQRMAEGLTDPEIAAKLYISLNTVKVTAATSTRNLESKAAHKRVKGKDLGNHTPFLIVWLLDVSINYSEIWRT